jgi:uncharacterized protein DUF4159
MMVNRMAYMRLAVSALLLGLTGTAAQAVPSTDGFRIGKLKYDGGGDWYSNPSSLGNLLKALKARTHVPISDFNEGHVSLLDDDLFAYPLIYMNGHGEVRFSAAEVERLREYIAHGGFLWGDDNYGMDVSFRREMAKVFPGTKLVELPFNHPIFSSYYQMPHGLPKVHEHDGLPAQALGIFQDGRLVVLYTYQSDIGDGIEDPEVHKDPAPIREEAMKFAVNVIVYAMTH